MFHSTSAGRQASRSDSHRHATAQSPNAAHRHAHRPRFIRNRHRIAAVLAAVLASCGADDHSEHLDPPPDNDAELPESLLWVALGDSYASGEGAPDTTIASHGNAGWFGDDADGAATTCHRSAGAASSRAATQVPRRSFEFHSLACSGSTIRGTGDTSIVGPGGQLEKLRRLWPSARVNVMTLTIGGNDVGFANHVRRCITANCDTTATTEQVRQHLTDLETNLKALAAEINDPAAADAPLIDHVVVVGYPDPTRAAHDRRCGTVTAPTFGVFLGISASEATWAANTVIVPLNDVLRRVAAEANTASGTHPHWEYVDVFDAFVGHSYCSGIGGLYPSNQRYVNLPEDSLTVQGDEFGSMHPNPTGYTAIADILGRRIATILNPHSPATEPPPTPPKPCVRRPCPLEP